MSNKIFLSPPHSSGEEQKYIQEAFSTNWLAPMGLNVDAFELGIQNYLGSNSKAVVLNSGTAAIHLALSLIGVSKGDDVICQSFTFIATANPIVYLGANPIFVDSEKETWNMCPELLEIAITDSILKGKKPKAILAVHSYGVSYQHKRLKAISEKFQIPIIEDAACAMGSSLNKVKCGAMGDFGIISFNGNKIITTSGGGALICRSEKDREKALFLATQAKESTPQMLHNEVGFNYRMSNILAGIGRGQMEALEKRINARRSNFEFYKSELSSYKNITFLDELEGSYSNRWLSCIQTDSFETREKIRLGLAEKDIESRPLWNPLHNQPVFKKCLSYTNGVSEELFEKGLCLPSGSNLTLQEKHRIVNTIKELL